MSLSTTEADGEDDDYLTMSFDEPPTSKIETLTQRKKRLAREAEIKGRPKSKAELAAEEKAKREKALASNTLDTSNKGFKMMAALGYKPGTALGASRDKTPNGAPDERLLEPVGVEMREGRSGIGADAEKKRQFREAVSAREDDVKKRKVDETDFRVRQQQEREEKKMEGQTFGAMKICEGLEEDDDAATSATPATQAADGQAKARTRPLHSVNVLWRGLVRERALKERDRRMRYDLHQSLSRRADYDDPDEDEDDRRALGKKADLEEVDIDLDRDDEELEQFEALEVSERLRRLVDYLRERWHYCFWCKFRYTDAAMEGCPGTTEDDHD